MTKRAQPETDLSKKTISRRENGRAGGIRTRGLFVPNEALYQAEPQPDAQSFKSSVWKGSIFAYFWCASKQNPNKSHISRLFLRRVGSAAGPEVRFGGTPKPAAGTAALPGGIGFAAVSVGKPATSSVLGARTSSLTTSIPHYEACKSRKPEGMWETEKDAREEADLILFRWG